MEKTTSAELGIYDLDPAKQDSSNYKSDNVKFKNFTFDSSASYGDLQILTPRKVFIVTLYEPAQTWISWVEVPNGRLPNAGTDAS